MARGAGARKISTKMAEVGEGIGVGAGHETRRGDATEGEGTGRALVG
jgi:hypothetical protein